MKNLKDNFNVDIGEYVNSKLELKYDKNKGISVYSKEKINKGEILVVSKAIMAINLLKKKKMTVCVFNLITQIKMNMKRHLFL